MENKVFKPHSVTTKVMENNNLHLFVWLHFATILAFALLTSKGFASERQDYVTKIVKFNASSNNIGRTPANFVPNDDYEVTPIEQHVWYENILVEDDKGVLRKVKADLKEWEAKDRYVEAWDLESTGLFDNIPSINERKQYLGNHLLKYLDKRLAGEIKRAEDGSTLKKIGEVQKALRPQSEVGISRRIKVKFKARVLQGRAYIFVDNPYINYVTEITAGGSIYIKADKSFTDSKITTRLDYDVKGNTWVASATRPVAGNVHAQLSSSQSDKDMAFTKASNNTLRLIYNKSF